MNVPIPYGRHSISEGDIAEVVRVLRSDYITQGPEISKFEKAFSKYVGSNYAIAVSSGTAALHLSILTLGIKPGDKVITTPLTFAATANCIRYCGGEVVFADINPESYLLDFNYVKKLLEGSPKGTYKGIIPVDFAGRAIDIQKYKELADLYDMWLLEDSCHAPGGYIRDKETNEKQFCGNSKFADLSIFSFHPVKHIACGEGGMVTTNNKNYYNKLLQLRNHGITRNKEEFKISSDFANGLKWKENSQNESYPLWYMEMQELGYNYRLTDIQAALGRNQLKRADDNLKLRKSIAERYFNAFKDKYFIERQPGIIEGHAYHLYVIEVKDRLSLYNHLKNNNIFCQVHYIPCHLMPYYRDLGWKEGDLPAVEEYYKRCLSLPMFPTLKKKEQLFIIDKILEYYQ